MPHSLVNEEYPIIEIPNERLWGENYVLTFYDPGMDVGGLLSLGRWVLQPHLWRSATYISLSNDRVLTSKNYGKSHQLDVPSSGLFEIQILEPGKKLRYRYEGPADERTMTDLNTVGWQVGRNDLLQFDLEFTSDNPIWDMHAGVDATPDDRTENTSANFNSPGGHIEQHGYLSGTIKYANGETYRLSEIPSTRDHSRGKRDFTRYKGHIWANGIFPSGKSFHLFTMKTHGLDGIAAGRSAIIVDGKMHEAQLKENTDGWLNEANQLFRLFSLSFTSKVLGDFEIEATRLVNSVPMALTFPADHYWSVPAQSRLKHMTWVNEQKVLWAWGDEAGSGHIERGNSSFTSTDPEWLSNFGAA